MPRPIRWGTGARPSPAQAPAPRSHPTSRGTPDTEPIGGPARHPAPPQISVSSMSQIQHPARATPWPSGKPARAARARQNPHDAHGGGDTPAIASAHGRQRKGGRPGPHGAGCGKSSREVGSHLVPTRARHNDRAVKIASHGLPPTPLARSAHRAACPHAHP
jgi:hypothetical protein